ncbi:hypothetical protein [Luteolibacter sp. Populi]|uniref:hypothetical protein n=1 Tax=Luteolibacter sp. Populi TaxID=3230487 RepID=UPI003466E04D
MNDIIQSFVDVWPAVVLIEAGSLAFVALDARGVFDELDRERESAKQVLSSCDMDVGGLRRRIAELEGRAEKLADRRLDVAAMKAGIDHAPGPAWMDGWFDGIITAAVEEREVRLLEDERLRKEGVRIEARAAWLQARAEVMAANAAMVREESAARVAEMTIALRLKPLRDCLADATQRRIDLDEIAAGLGKQIENKEMDPDLDPVKRLAVLAVQARLEAVQKEFKSTLMLEAELERKIIEMCEKS